VNVHELAEAVKRGDAGAVRLILHAKPELVNTDLAENNEHRAIHFAVLQRDAAMVKLLMEAGADARKGIYPHRDATAALTIAREREYAEIVALIEEEERLRREELSCPNATVSPVQDRIGTAISDGDTAQAIALLEADPSLIQACDRNGATPLHIAAEEGDVELVSWLLERRAKVDKRDLRDHTPLDCAALAACERFSEVARLLMDHGAEVTLMGAVALGDTSRVRQAERAALRRVRGDGGLLTLAVHHGQLEIVRLLLDLGADVDERVQLAHLAEPVASWGMPLWNAAGENRYEICELLLDRGADPNANVYASGWPLGRAWNHADGRVKKLLMERGAKLQPYMVSATHNMEEAGRMLREDASEELAQELLWSAADSGCAAIVEFALPHLSWPNEDPRWHWVLIQPIRGGMTEGHFACMELLLKRGVDPNVSRYGQTVLHFVAGYRGEVSDEARARFAGMLIDAGASLGVRDDLLKSTPLGWACRWGRRRMVEVLVARGATMEEVEAEPWARPGAWVKKMGGWQRGVG
jgi:ankyrin repeat protein